MELDFERCYRAVDSRDPRFDGWFVTAVTSTRIYCRPSCPALTPRRANVRFLPSSAAAQRAGFRACLRCRPDAAPGSPEWNNRADVVAQAMRLIADGVVDRDGVPGLAARLRYTERHLHRLLQAELGAGPLALARAQRAQTARTLIETTGLGYAEVAFAAGFGSVRQFNDTIREVYGRSPSQLRSARRGGGAEASTPGTISLRLPFRAPLHAAALLDFLAARTVPGVDEVAGDAVDASAAPALGRAAVGSAYQRSVRLPHGPGTVRLRPAVDAVHATLSLHDLRDLSAAVARCRHLLDLDADPAAVDAVLSADPALSALVKDAPGVRVPRAVDGFEMAVRGIVGQQVSVVAARSVLGKLCAASATDGHGFPTPAMVLDAPDEAFAMPAARRRSIRALAAAVAAGDLHLDAGSDRSDAEATLLALPGIGPWTASYIALRALGDPDAFLPTDLGVRRGAAALGVPDEPAALSAYAERWRPWRAYALIHLWRRA